jgi:hypothetical protein
MIVSFAQLNTSLPPPNAVVPSASILPARAALPAYTGATYVSTSDTCSRGSIVTVTPTGVARLTVAIRTHDRSVTGLGVQDLTAPVTIAAWQSGHYLGALTVTPPQRATATPSPP